ncbi:hypothetical protein WICPIJ_003688 [Wickerhamomyces pijperi]|uniref:SVP1-like protein 2 n=1 Tax=Wickerhamomyces pijperi TaxID=599730 RepID=A0A9P8TNG8_WICPI|nr:hypothetical protein WICPIJ_003688 [Wickerhamomyces pijperi]
MKTTKSLIEKDTSKQSVLSCAFNQDFTCFTLSTESGFKVYNTDPMELKVSRNFTDNGGIGQVRMLYRTNYLALIGGGRDPKFPLNKVVIWDDLKGKDALMLNFYSPVLNVFLSRSRIVSVLNSRIYVHGFGSPPRSIANYETCENPLGIAALSPGSYSDNSAGNNKSDSITTTPNSPAASVPQVLAFPSRVQGQIQVVDISNIGNERNLVSIIKAHKSKVRCIALNKAGTMVASASESGTLIRIHSTQTCSLLYEFRRGLDRAVVYAMEFSPSGSKLAVMSDKQTLHVFNVSSNTAQQNKHHLLKNLPVPLKPDYFNSVWSFASTHLDQSHDVDVTGNNNKGKSDITEGVLGWADENNMVILWRSRAKWEIYEIVEKEASSSHSVTTSDHSDNNGSASAGSKNYEIIRKGWRSFNDNSSELTETFPSDSGTNV